MGDNRDQTTHQKASNYSYTSLGMTAEFGEEIGGSNIEEASPRKC
jgi:hypothetical protein